tara:strand:+ start:141 stop:470 length:330 start_codon:yes stop_codon:yes gene_type:complete
VLAASDGQAPYLSTPLSIYLSIYLSIHPSIHPFHPSIYLRVSIYLSIYLRSNGQAENAQLFYDAYRCARCPQPLAVGSSADLSSSFFQLIDLLHARLHDAPNTPGTIVI